MKSLASTLVFLFAMTLIGLPSIALGQSLTTIDFPGALDTLALDINERGDIVGRYINADKKTHAFLLSKGVFTTIDFPGAIVTTANGINSRTILIADRRGRQAMSLSSVVVCSRRSTFLELLLLAVPGSITAENSPASTRSPMANVMGFFLMTGTSRQLMFQAR